MSVSARSKWEADSSPDYGGLSTGIEGKANQTGLLQVGLRFMKICLTTNLIGLAISEVQADGGQ